MATRRSERFIAASHTSLDHGYCPWPAPTDAPGRWAGHIYDVTRTTVKRYAITEQLVDYLPEAS